MTKRCQDIDYRVRSLTEARQPLYAEGVNTVKEFVDERNREVAAKLKLQQATGVAGNITGWQALFWFLVACAVGMAAEFWY